MLSQTALYEAHIASGAKTGEFAGYDMPLYYNEGVIAEHEWVRSAEDFVWRRTRLGLKLNAAQIKAIDKFIADKCKKSSAPKAQVNS